MSDTYSEYPNNVLQYVESLGWSTNLTKLRDGTYIIAGSQKGDSGTDKMLLMIVCEPENKVTIEHLEYLIEGRRQKNVGSIRLTNSVKITQKAKNFAEEHGITILSSKEVRSHAEANSFDLSTDEISMPNSSPETQVDKESDHENQTVRNKKESANSSTSKTNIKDGYHDVNEFSIGHVISVGLLSVIPTFILIVILPSDFGSFGIFGFFFFAYIGYQCPNVKSAFGKQSFWSAIMLLVSPIMFIIETLLLIEGTSQGPLQTSGALLGGIFVNILAFVVVFPLGIAFYFLHKKFEIDER